MKKGCRMGPLGLNKFKGVTKAVLGYNMRQCYLGKIDYIISIMCEMF